ncbi:hypothetical protein AB0L59_33810 [Streptomyces sp. NPDC052109]|uniref:hypothetical protein n=1 Tax=Streptomyces sp. NPDC052109 TaxID=3155527 RepID=UPI00343610B5
MTRALEDDNATIWSGAVPGNQVVETTTKRTEHALLIGHKPFVITQHLSFTVAA